MIEGEFDEIGQLFFEIELIAETGENFPVLALLDTGSTEWLVINNQDLEALKWLKVGTKAIQTARGKTNLEIYLGKVRLDEEEFSIEVIATSEIEETLIGIPWVRIKRLVIDFPASILTLG